MDQSDRGLLEGASPSTFADALMKMLLEIDLP